MDDDDQILGALARELAAKASGPFEVVLRPLTALHLAGLIQLALRHPAARQRASHLATGGAFLAGVRAYFADCPAVLEVLRRGDDPAEDR
jgi:hypothetical protein